MPIPTAVSKSVGTSAVKSKPREQEKVLLEKEKEKEKDKAAVPPPMPKVQSKYPFSWLIGYLTKFVFFFFSQPSH